MTTVMLAFGVFGSRSTQTELRIASNGLLAKKAQAAAEAGVNHAFRLLKEGGAEAFTTALNTGTEGPLVNLGAVRELDGQNHRFRAFGGVGPADGYYVRAVNGYTNNQMKLISRGRVGGAEGMIELLLNGSPSVSLFPFALFGKQFVQFGGNGGFVDSYNSNVAPYSAATRGSNSLVASNGFIQMNSDTTINGSAKAVGTISCSTTPCVTGTTQTGAAPVTLAPDPVPICGIYSDGTGISGAYTYSSNGDKAGQLIVGSGGTATLAPGTYCFSSVKVDGTLRISGEVVMYLTEPSRFGSGGISNPSGKPENFQIFSSSTDPKAGIVINGGSDAYAAVYAPNTGIVLGGAADFYGALVGNYIESPGGAKFHYDEALGGIGAVTSAPVTLVVWHEFRNL